MERMLKDPDASEGSQTFLLISLVKRTQKRQKIRAIHAASKDKRKVCTSGEERWREVCDFFPMWKLLSRSHRGVLSQHDDFKAAKEMKLVRVSET